MISSAFAVPIVASSPAGYPVQWLSASVAAALAQQPQYLKIYTMTHISHPTRITVQGLDCNNQPVEAIAVNKWQSGLAYYFSTTDPTTWNIPASTGPEYLFPLVDVHSGKEVTFSKVTAIYQQGGEQGDEFKLMTHNEPYYLVYGGAANPITKPHEVPLWLGSYHMPVYKPAMVGPIAPSSSVGGQMASPPETIPIQPTTPSQVVILVGWQDVNNNNYPDLPADTASGAQFNATLTVTGLSCNGTVQTATVSVTGSPNGGQGQFGTPGVGNGPIIVPGIWMDISSVTGGATGDSYFFFTWPPAVEQDILTYTINIDHLVLAINPMNIMANGTDSANIQTILMDMDNHQVHWSSEAGVKNITLNVISTGGQVTKSVDQGWSGCHTNWNETIVSDTNARTIKVAAIAIIPTGPPANYPGPSPLYASALMGFDGFNSNQIYTHADFLGKPGSGSWYNVFIKLSVRCNLVSIPIFPGSAITPKELWNASASTVIQSISWYNATSGTWNIYDYTTVPPTVTGSGNAALVPGVGYWIKAEKPCTLVISGHFYDQAPFVPPEIHLQPSWNLVGVVIDPSYGFAIGTTVQSYLQTLRSSGDDKMYGPVWVYNNDLQSWFRLGDTDTLWPGQAFWLSVIEGPPYIGP